jgi:hypothetical protein
VCVLRAWGQVVYTRGQPALWESMQRALSIKRQPLGRPLGSPAAVNDSMSAQALLEAQQPGAAAPPPANSTSGGNWVGRRGVATPSTARPAMVNRAAQDLDADGRTVVNMAQFWGARVCVTASGTYEPEPAAATADGSDAGALQVGGSGRQDHPQWSDHKEWAGDWLSFSCRTQWLSATVSGTGNQSHPVNHYSMTGQCHLPAVSMCITVALVQRQSVQRLWGLII